MTALINPTNLEIIDYTVYLGDIDLNDENGLANVSYTPIAVLNSCNDYMAACVNAFQSFAINPNQKEPSGGIQDWVISPDGSKIYGFLGIENGMMVLDLAGMTVSCVSGPAMNAQYTGTTGVKTDEIGGMYFENGELYGWQVDRGRLFKIDQMTGKLTLVNEGLPQDWRGDNATCRPCAQESTNMLVVCPDETTSYTVTVTDENGCTNTATVTVTVNPLPTPAISGDLEICDGETTTLTASGGTSYEWNTGATTASINVSPSTTTTYSVTVTNADGCEASTSATVIVNPLPSTITGDTEICEEIVQKLTAESENGVIYEWSEVSEIPCQGSYC
ncbi:MAG: hypothetical protein R2766_02845 [Saprospiraceae bacterium]